MKIVYDKVNARITSEDDTIHVLYTNYLSCPDSVIEKVVELFNNKGEEYPLGPDGTIDFYLLNEELCSQEDREYICESIYTAFYNNHENLIV